MQNVHGETPHVKTCAPETRGGQLKESGLPDTTATTTWEEMPELMTIAEAARYMRTSRNWCYEAARSGELKPAATKLGRSIRIRKDALRRLLEGLDA